MDSGIGEVDFTPDVAEPGAVCGKGHPVRVSPSPAPLRICLCRPVCCLSLGVPFGFPLVCATFVRLPAAMLSVAVWSCSSPL